MVLGNKARSSSRTSALNHSCIYLFSHPEVFFLSFRWPCFWQRGYYHPSLCVIQYNASFGYSLDFYQGFKTIDVIFLVIIFCFLSLITIGLIKKYLPFSYLNNNSSVAFIPPDCPLWGFQLDVFFLFNVDRALFSFQISLFSLGFGFIMFCFYILYVLLQCLIFYLSQVLHFKAIQCSF